jgi:hypothetical protein
MSNYWKFFAILWCATAIFILLFTGKGKTTKTETQLSFIDTSSEWTKSFIDTSQTWEIAHYVTKDDSVWITYDDGDTIIYKQSLRPYGGGSIEIRKKPGKDLIRWIKIFGGK